jgi:autotransporter strand-loop-strand O-heptosyltransferase
MKIALINLGAIEIPPKSWGAIEKIMWNYKLQLEKLGHTVDIVFPWEIMENGKQKYDIVHFHAANQAIESYCDFMTPYVFSLHDHHVVRYGKQSPTFSSNLLAMKSSVASITHAEFLIDYFDTCDKLYYLSHGADTELYKDNGNQRIEHKLICVANNGYANEPSYDRKGFRYSIEAARKLNLPITIVGPKANRENFFKANPDLLEYSKLNIIHDPSETELIEIMNNHTIFLHPSELEAGHPNLTICESLACGLPVVGTYNGKEPLNGLIKCNRSTIDVVDKIKTVINDYDNYRRMARETALKYDWSIIVKQLVDFYTYAISVRDNFSREDMRKHVVNAYESGIIKYKEPVEPKPRYNVHMNGYGETQMGIFFEMLCETPKKINVDFIDKDTKSIAYHTVLTSNMYSFPSTRYHKNWLIKVTGDDNQTFDMDLKGKNVSIQFDSGSLGDSLAWIPYVEEFRKIHDCRIFCSTHQNTLYEKEYPDITFIKPGDPIHDIFATYKIGWFSGGEKKTPWGGDRDVQPNDYRLIPLQQTATDILGLKYREIRPRVTIPDMKRPIGDKYVVIAEHSTANAKYWQYKNGWQTIVNYLNNHGLKVMVISKQGTILKNVINETGDQSLEKRINQINHSEFMLGVGSGVSWLSWAVGKKVIMISGFSKPFCEFQENCIRVHNNDVCNGCFNDIRYTFDRGDWNWCPANKNTPKMFECTKLITPQMVIDAIEKNKLL